MNQINSPAFYQAPVQQQQQQPPQQTQQVMQPHISQQNSNMQLNPNVIANQATFQIDSDIINDGLIDPVLKCKELMMQLRQSLQLLLPQLSNVLNPSNENSRIQNENQFQMLGKNVENFNRMCDLLVVNLRFACESQTISSELKYMNRYYAHMGAMDQARSETPYMNSINIQMQRINDFRALLQRYLNTSNQVKQAQSNENMI